MADDIVKFLMPDGTEVSNDPRFGLKEALQKQLDSTEYRGDAGIPEDEFKAQTQVEHPASLNSGQPGVGENAVPEDATKDLHGPLGSPAQQVQKDDLKEAKEAKASPKSTSVEDAEPVDSNKAVLEARQAKADRAKAALEAANEEPGDPEKPYSEWTSKQLKAEIAKRNAETDRAEEDQLQIEKGMKKSDVADLLDSDDERAQSAGTQE